MSFLPGVLEESAVRTVVICTSGTIRRGRVLRILMVEQALYKCGLCGSPAKRSWVHKRGKHCMVLGFLCGNGRGTVPNLMWFSVLRKGGLRSTMNHETVPESSQMVPTGGVRGSQILKLHDVNCVSRVVDDGAESLAHRQAAQVLERSPFSMEIPAENH